MADPAPTQDQPAKPQDKPKRHLPWGYLVFATLIFATLVVLVFAPQLPRQWLGGDPPRPDALGDGPAAVGDIDDRQLSERELAAERAVLGTVRTAAPQAPPATNTPQAGPVRPTAPVVDEDAKGRQILAEAEAAYQAMAWDKAESAARRVAALNAQAKTKGRAADIARAAPILKNLFKELDDRDELNRNWDSHPALVRLVRGAQSHLAVPIMQMAPPYNPVTEDPAGWVETQRKTGKVMVLLKGVKQFTPAEMDLSDYAVVAADTAAQRAEALRALDDMESRVKADARASASSFSWYELGKFAYRNRIDDKVVPFLDKAVERDPFLARSVRETNAALLFGALVAHHNAGNKQQAAAFMALIERRFKDTDQGKQARLFYDGKRGELIAASRAAAQREKEAAEAARRERIEHEKRKGDEERARQIAAQKTEQEEEEEELAAAPQAPVDANLASARDLASQGGALLGEASNMPAGPERNKKYKAAEKLLVQAKALLAKLQEKNPSEETEAELVAASKMLFMAKKSQTL